MVSGFNLRSHHPPTSPRASRGRTLKSMLVFLLVCYSLVHQIELQIVCMNVGKNRPGRECENFFRLHQNYYRSLLVGTKHSLSLSLSAMRLPQFQPNHCRCQLPPHYLATWRDTIGSIAQTFSCLTVGAFTMQTNFLPTASIIFPFTPIYPRPP